MAIPTVIVEVAFSAGASTQSYLHLDDPTRGKLDTGTLAPDAVWTDVSDFVLSASTRRGSNRVTSPTIRYEAGTVSIVLDNSDRRFDPTNLAGPYVVAGITQVTPMRAVRVRAVWAGVTYDLFRGFADEWRTTFADPSYSEMLLTASDAFKVFANINRAAGGSVGAGENAGARINRILDSTGWSATDRQVATGNSALQATTLADNVLTELQLTEDSELGEFYVDGAGRAVFRNRQGLLTDSRSVTAQATFGDGGGAELAYEVVDVMYDDATMVNRARISRVGGTEQAADDASSQSLYLIRTIKRDGLLMQADTDAKDYANFLVYVAAQPELRFASMTIFPREDENNLFPQVLARQIGDRLTVVRRPPGGGSAITRDVFIRGIEQQIDIGHDWRTTFHLQSATRYQFLVLDHPTLGKLDSNALGY